MSKALLYLGEKVADHRLSLELVWRECIDAPPQGGVEARLGRGLPTNSVNGGRGRERRIWRRYAGLGPLQVTKSLALRAPRLRTKSRSDARERCAAVHAAFPPAAADYPAKPIRIIVGFASGGAPDTLARVVGDKLAHDWRYSGKHTRCQSD